jgi:indolepyruvate ferredoxin oxidoreductase
MTGGQRVGERPEGHSVLQIMNSLLPKAWSSWSSSPTSPANTWPHNGDGAKHLGAERPAAGIVFHRDELDASSASSARSRAARPSSTTRPAPPKSAAAKRHLAGQDRGHQRAGLRGLWRLLGAVQLPVGGAGGDRVRPQAPHQPEQLQQGLSCVKGFCPSFVTVEGGSSKSPRRRRRASLSALPPFPSRCCPWPSRPGASWWPVSAARA